jgi:hypothetical protein
MAVNAEARRQLIDARKQNTARSDRLWARDEWRDFEVWQVPVEALLMNVDNRRFAAERRLIEEKLGHSLDPENSPSDERAVEALLLDVGLDVDGDRVTGKASKDYHALKADWMRRRQESPLWIRPDGLVRNGNRRLAMLKRLQLTEGLEGFEYVDAVILDAQDIDEVALFDMEQREQLTENLKVRYTDINLLLAVRAAAEARSIDWYSGEDIQRVASELQHIVGDNEAYAIVQLNAIKYMDAYLEDSGQPAQYHKLIGQIERFRDVGRAMAQVELEYPDDAADMLRVLFAAIRAGLPHGKIRELRRIFRYDRERYKGLLEEIGRVERPWEEAEVAEGLADPQVVGIGLSEDEAETDGEGDDALEPPGPNVPNYPTLQVADAIEDALDSFQASQTDDVVRTLKQVTNRLAVLTDEAGQLTRALASEERETVLAALRDVVEWADDQRRHLAPS